MPPNNTPFRPFETNLDQSRALAILRQAVAGGDDGELYLERHRSEFLTFDDGRLRNASYDSGAGFGLRAVAGGAEVVFSVDTAKACLRTGMENFAHNDLTATGRGKFAQQDVRKWMARQLRTRDDRPDDIAYVSDVIDHVAASVCIDLTHVYVTGFSGGGRMT